MRYSFLFDCDEYHPSEIESLPYTETENDIREAFGCNHYATQPGDTCPDCGRFC